MRRTIMAYAAIMLAAGALAGCREEEQGRPLVYDKGTYAGPPVAELSKAQVEALSSRAALQGAGGTGGTGAPAPAPQDSQPREVQEQAQGSAASASDKALSDRLKLQSGK